MLAEAIGDGLLDGLRAPSSPRWSRASPTNGEAPTVPEHCHHRAGPPRTSRNAYARSSASHATSTTTKTTPASPRRGPDPGFTLHVYEWVGGDLLADVLDDDEMTGGDFVRNVKQCIDLLGQVATVAPDAHTRDTAREAAAGCNRGVVAASSVAGVNRLTP